MKPVPSDFVEMSNKMGNAARPLSRHYLVSPPVIKRWMGIMGIEQAKAKPPIQLPDDYTSNALEMTQAELCKHYTVSHGIITRWAVETGVHPKRFIRGRRGKAAEYLINEPDEYELAVRYLQGYMPVNKCDEKGVFNLNGKYYRVGMSVLTDDELLDKVEAHKERYAKKTDISLHIPAI